jgi:hypothetical protein
VLEEDDKGRKVPRKIGLAPVQRDGLEYEFDVVGDIDTEHKLIVSKSRCPAVDGKVIHKPGAPFAAQLREWLAVEPSKPAPEPADTKIDDTPVRRIPMKFPGEQFAESMMRRFAENDLKQAKPEPVRVDLDPVASFTAALNAAQTVEDLARVVDRIKSECPKEIRDQLGPVYSARRRDIVADAAFAKFDERKP